jgi:hypothetical protein
MKKLINIVILLFVSWTILQAQTSEKFIPVSSDVRYQYIETYSLSKLEQVFNKDLEDFLAGSKMKVVIGNDYFGLGVSDLPNVYVTSVIRLKPWFDGFLKKK